MVGWTLVVLLLLAVRLPSLAEPAGGDQGLYAYAGQRILAGGVPYRDSWDQKPPAIFFVYACLWRIWPHESVVAAADLAAAGLVAWLLIILGRRVAGAATGYAAACLFLLFGDPSLSGLVGGVYVRGQCETFIALAVTTALVLVVRQDRRRWHLVLAGVWLAIACWLKYNAVVYGLPVALALWLWPSDGAGAWRRWAGDLAGVALGFALVTATALLYFAGHGVLQDLRLATIDYNLRYSSETYAGPVQALAYLFHFPVARARADLLWFLGGLGALLLGVRLKPGRPALIVLGWGAASILSVAVNSARDLPQYFVQANPALALAAAAGLAGLSNRGRWVRYLTLAAVATGLWRVGTDAPAFGGPRLGRLPRVVDNLRIDVAALRGQEDRATYLARFRGTKYDAPEIDDLARYVRDTTQPADPILVFGFAGGSVCVKSARRSASRFFWSRPVVIEFAADHPGYGSAGLLRDLEQHPPALVALQKRDWHSAVDAAPHSADFFMANGPLRAWLEAGYVAARDTALFAVWRRRS
jgi:hypothetical protein